MNGMVVDENKETIIGAHVVATHMPSGTVYVGITNEKGRYTINGMRVGNPYKVEISYIGYKTVLYTGLDLALGESLIIDATMQEDNQSLGEVEVIATSKTLFQEKLTGAAISFDEDALKATPTISHSVFDVAKYSPFVKQTGSGLSIAGSHNRFNSFQIDGTPNNDIFGISSSGTNGGMIGANPIALDAIEEIQVVVAPFDVRQGGFTGGGINAITKSGTNEFKTSAYVYYQNQALTGKTPGAGVTNRTKLDDQMRSIYGATVGGALRKDKLFYFASLEIDKQENPTAYNYGDERSLIPTETADLVKDKLMQLTGGYDGGGFTPLTLKSPSLKFLAKLDWNINSRNTLSVRYNLLSGNTETFETPNSPNNLQLNDHRYLLKNKTHSIVAELRSRVGDKLFNNFRAGATIVEDLRDPAGQSMPAITIELGEGNRINMGSERYSTANMLKQQVYSITDNLSFYAGDHTITVGTHNEFYYIYNYFMQDAFGAYTYRSLDDFLKIGTAQEVAPLDYSYLSQRKDASGNSLLNKDMTAARFSVYAQDEWYARNNLLLTYGVRADIAYFGGTPNDNVAFNSSSLAKQYDVATTQMPRTQVMFSPRVGFRWHLNEDHTSLLRGGVGLFTGSAPFVWLFNYYFNTGMEFNRTQLLTSEQMNAAWDEGFRFNADPNKQYASKQTLTSEINVISGNYKSPQNLRANLSWEHIFPGGVKATIEGLYSKTLSSIYYQNLLNTPTGHLNNGGDQRPTYSILQNPATGNGYDKEYTNVFYLTNSTKGYSYNLSAKLEKTFDFGLSAMASYTYGRSKSINDIGGSLAFEGILLNPQYAGSNTPELSFSAHDMPHRVVASLSYNKDYAKHYGTNVSLFYSGHSGPRYSYTYYGDINNDNFRTNDLMYIPTDAEFDAMRFADHTDAAGKVLMTAAEQKQLFGEFVQSQDYLHNNKGSYAERNGAIAPFEHHFDLHIAQNFYVYSGTRKHTLQVGFDILNVGNLLNPKWGIYHATNLGSSFSPLTMSRVDAAGVPTFKFTERQKEALYSVSDLQSRWKAQISLRYIF